ncbi:MAG: RidA family protein [Alcaligenaceae bacterium]|nr:RidA family protein [Alcaligenaceae bacterium]
MKQMIHTNNAPAAIGPYSQAISSHGMLFLSGQLGLDPKTGELQEGIEAQAKQAFSNLKEVLEAGGSSLNQVLKLTLFLSDLADFAVVNELMKTVFSEPFPARSTVQVAALPKGALFEVDAIAAV